MKQIEYKKSAVVLVFNSAGELALQLRAEHDTSYPSHWDFSAGGGIDAEETPEQAAKRELQEELGIKVGVRFIVEERLVYPAWKPNTTKDEHAYIFTSVYDGSFSPNPDEVAEVRFFTLDAIKEMMASNGKFHMAFRLAWEKGLVSKAKV